MLGCCDYSRYITYLSNWLPLPPITSRFSVPFSVRSTPSFHFQHHSWETQPILTIAESFVFQYSSQHRYTEYAYLSSPFAFPPFFRVQQWSGVNMLHFKWPLFSRSLVHFTTRRRFFCDIVYTERFDDFFLSLCTDYSIRFERQRENQAKPGKKRIIRFCGPPPSKK